MLLLYCAAQLNIQHSAIWQVMLCATIRNVIGVNLSMHYEKSGWLKTFVSLLFPLVMQNHLMKAFLNEEILAK